MGGAGTLLGIWQNPTGAVQISGSTCRVYNIFRLLRLIINEYIPRDFAYNVFALGLFVLNSTVSHSQNPIIQNRMPKLQ